MINLPKLLSPVNRDSAISALRSYYQGGVYSGAHFDAWRPSPTNEFTPDDIIAVSFLSVNIPPLASREILVSRPDDFNAYLLEVPDADLVNVSESIDRSHPLWQLENELRRLSHVGTTIASKLVARKRPRLWPIYDSVVTDLLGTKSAHVEPIRRALRANGHELNEQLIDLRRAAELPHATSAIRVLDVLAWMEGRGDVRGL